MLAALFLSHADLEHFIGILSPFKKTASSLWLELHSVVSCDAF